MLPPTHPLKWWGATISFAHIQKGGFRGFQNPQTILNFPQIVWECKNYQDNTVCRAFDCHFPLIIFSPYCWERKKFKHSIFSKNTPWHQILVILTIYALLWWNFIVRIYALFPQIFFWTEKLNLQTLSFFGCMYCWLKVFCVLSSDGNTLYHYMILPLNNSFEKSWTIDQFSWYGYVRWFFACPVRRPNCQLI